MADCTRVLTLFEGHIQESTLYRIEKGTTLQFTLGSLLRSRDVRLFSNHPQQGRTYDRQTFHELRWDAPKNEKLAGLGGEQVRPEFSSNHIDRVAEINIIQSGSFYYFFTIDGTPDPHNASGSGYFLVDPRLTVGADNEYLPLDAVSCQTYVSKLLGPFPDWEQRLAVAKNTGYNMVHLSPIQELGYSNSAYCIRDQLQVSSKFGSSSNKITYCEVGKFLKKMRTEWKVLSVADLVYNHTSTDSPWLQEHPESSYNLHNSPHLRPAYLLDKILWHFTLDVAAGKWEYKGVPAAISGEKHLAIIERIVRDTILPIYRLHEFYMMDVKKLTAMFRRMLMQPADASQVGQLHIIQDEKFNRLSCTVNLDLARKLFDVPRITAMSAESDAVTNTVVAFEQRLNDLNAEMMDEIYHHIDAGIKNFLANVHYRFIDPNGMKLGTVSEKSPLMWYYFTWPERTEDAAEDEALMNSDQNVLMMAHNGWVMCDDPLRNFAEPGSMVYLRRELIPWGDNVKLRYGREPGDSPFLWKHMLEYTKETATIFHGVRLDNCHSTPMHVAEYLLDEARKIRPDLYVMAELFTGNEHMDNLFINRLGITSLVREAQNAWSAQEQGRIIHRYGGKPVGAFLEPNLKPLAPSMAHAMLCDQTHDNPSHVEKRCASDVAATAAMVASSCSAIGSNRGFDELIPHHINVVTEKRLYPKWTCDSVNDASSINDSTGIIAVKRALNELHSRLGREQFNQVYVHNLCGDTVAVTRRNPSTSRAVIVIARSAFAEPKPPLDVTSVPAMPIEGIVDGIVLEVLMTASVKTGPAAGAKHVFQKDKNFLNGLTTHRAILKRNIRPEHSGLLRISFQGESNTMVKFFNFPPGSAVALSVRLSEKSEKSIMLIHKILADMYPTTESLKGVVNVTSSNLNNVVSALNLIDINRVMYRCEDEEQSDGLGIGCYSLPHCGKLVYAGLQGVMSVLQGVQTQNDLGHHLCDNLRQGDWLPDYIWNRLLKFEATKELGRWLRSAYAPLKSIPRYLIPCYFGAITTGVYVAVQKRAWLLMSEFSNSSTLARALSIASVQFCGKVMDCKMPPMLETASDLRQISQFTLAAGLPHFSHGIFRSWGRDTFISLRGLLLIPGRTLEARALILAFGGTLRHGLIPNLFGEGVKARFNCRDAVWFWLQSVKDYCLMVENGDSILQDQTRRMFLTHTCEPNSSEPQTQRLYEVMQEALQTHATGLSYRECNAGAGLDWHMRDEGFNNEIGIDWDTGFVFGGNEHNCGTWMDKMGSSEKAGNRGKPATPRNGSAIELVGLCKSVVSWLSESFCQGKYPYKGVKATIGGKEREVSFAHWSHLIQTHFEKHFWINLVPELSHETEAETKYVNRRGIYKDSIGSTPPWANYQLRPNFTVAMVVAPELFTPLNAWQALRAVEDYLLGPLGLRTLDPTDWAYRGDYQGDDDSTNYETAQGFNYHQGPEWLWLMGYFLRARIIFSRKLVCQHSRRGSFRAIDDETTKFVLERLAAHHRHLLMSDWKSLPELTNANGAPCGGSCPAQAWSVGCLLEALYELQHKQTSKPA